MQSALGNPVTRFILGAVVTAVVVADGIVLIGFTSTIPGSAVPVRVPVTVQTQVSAPPSSSETTPAAPPAATAPAATAPAATAPAVTTPAATAHPQPRPRPKAKSPFEDRCRSGQIPAWLCRGLPR